MGKCWSLVYTGPSGKHIEPWRHACICLTLFPVCPEGTGAPTTHAFPPTLMPCHRPKSAESNGCEPSDGSKPTSDNKSFFPFS